MLYTLKITANYDFYNLSDRYNMNGISVWVFAMASRNGPYDANPDI